MVDLSLPAAVLSGAFQCVSFGPRLSHKLLRVAKDGSVCIACTVASSGATVVKSALERTPQYGKAVIETGVNFVVRNTADALLTCLPHEEVDPPLLLLLYCPLKSLQAQQESPAG